MLLLNSDELRTGAGTVQYVYAVRGINMGEQLCVHYTSLYEPRKVRQQALLQEKFFSCACERCSTPIEHSVDRFLEVAGILHYLANVHSVLITHQGRIARLVFKARDTLTAAQAA